MSCATVSHNSQSTLCSQTLESVQLEFGFYYSPASLGSKSTHEIDMIIYKKYSIDRTSTHVHTLISLIPRPPRWNSKVWYTLFMNTHSYIINPRPEGYGTCSVIRSFVHSFIRSVHRAAEMSGRFYALVRLWAWQARQWLAIWLVDFAKMLLLSSYDWLALSEFSEDKTSHSWIHRPVIH